MTQPASGRQEESSPAWDAKSMGPGRSVHSKPQHAHNTHNTTHTELYMGNIFTTKIAHIAATYKISEH